MGTFCSMFAFSNTIFVGLPVNIALFGDDSVPFVLLYYIACTTLFWTVGCYGIRRDGGSVSGKILSWDNLRKIFSPPFTAFLFAIVLVLLNIKLPKTILDTCKYLGNITTPLSLLFIGIAIQAVKLRDIKFSKDMGVLIAGRLVFAPLLVFGLWHFFAIPVLMKKVFFIQASMPIMTNTSIIADAYDADQSYAAVMITVTTVLSMVVVPFYMMFLGKFVT